MSGQWGLAIIGRPTIVAASSNFPLLMLAIYWRGLTTLGAPVGALAAAE